MTASARSNAARMRSKPGGDGVTLAGMGQDVEFIVLNGLHDPATDDVRSTARRS